MAPIFDVVQAAVFSMPVQHEQQPRFPCIRARDIEQQTVVVRFVGDDVAAEVEDRKRQQLFLDQEKAVEHPSGSAVAVGEWVDCFELVVSCSHSDQRVDGCLVVKKALPVGEEVSNSCFHPRVACR